MGEFAEFPSTAPDYKTQKPGRFDQYIMLKGAVSEVAPKNNQQLQNGITDNQVLNNVPLQGAVRESEIRTSVTDSSGTPTYCLRIEDQNSLNRDVFRSPFTGQIYHNVFIKQSDYAVVQRAKGAGTTEQINLYDNTGHLIQPVYAAAVGSWFTVNFKPSTVVLNIYESPSVNNQPTLQRSNFGNSAAIPDGLKQKYNKYKPMIQGLLKQLR